MASWQYAWLTDQPYTTIGFSHPQPGLAAELAAVLGPGIMIQQSSEWSISLDRSRVNLGYVSGLMGDRGWEMFAVETRLQPNAITPAQLQTNWYFKRQAPDRPAGAAMTTASTSAPMQTTMGGGSMGAASMGGASEMASVPPAAPMSAAPAMAAAPEMAPAAPMSALSEMAPASPMTTGSEMAPAPEMTPAAQMAASSPEMAPQMAPPAAMPSAPTAPPGPEQAPLSGVGTPPPGPEAATMPQSMPPGTPQS